MNDALIVARLTVMLLRASLAHPDSLRSGHGIVLPPSDSVMSMGDALERIASMNGPVTFNATAKGGELVITMTRANQDEVDEMEYRRETFGKGLNHAGALDESPVLVRAMGLEESMVVPARVLDRWFRFANCRPCSLSLGAPGAQTPDGVVAVLYLGPRR
jgi:hypothetical protein